MGTKFYCNSDNYFGSNHLITVNVRGSSSGSDSIHLSIPLYSAGCMYGSSHWQSHNGNVLEMFQVSPEVWGFPPQLKPTWFWISFLYSAVVVAPGAGSNPIVMWLKQRPPKWWMLSDLKTDLRMPAFDDPFWMIIVLRKPHLQSNQFNPWTGSCLPWKALAKYDSLDCLIQNSWVTTPNTVQIDY